MADVTGIPVPAATDEFDVPGDLKALADYIGDVSMFEVATASALPMTGNWVGRRLLAADTGVLYRWNGSGWKALFDVVKSVPAKVLVGSPPPVGTPLIRQSGILQTVSPTNSNGDGSIDYPTPFPNGVISAHLDRYDFSTVGPSVHIIHTVQTLTTLNYRIYGTSGSPAPGIRPWFSIDVVGW
ncbi:hypothetical protein [Microbacterium sp.]|uniref:gp53-like domain-containing protein n=1 Tax=Microbacterium sp. TaxID=51671 RepID=UPI0032420DA3